MPRINPISLFKQTPVRVLLPSALMLLLFAGSIFLYFLPSLEKELMNSKKEIIREMTSSVIGSLNHLQSQVEQGTISRETAMTTAKGLVKALRYGRDSKDYFWISDMDARMVIHPYLPELDGQDLSEFRDLRGTPLFTTFADTIRQNGSGFVEYYWQWKDQPEQIAHKISYIRPFKPWGWILGTGMYIDDVTAEIAIYRNKIAVMFFAILVSISLLSLYIIRQTYLSEQKKASIQKQRERLVKVLQESEERYRTIADFAYDWETWVDGNGTILYCSPACKRITGYPPERFFATPELVRDIIIEEDRPTWDDYCVSANTDQGDSLDFRITSAHGDPRWLSVVGRAVSGIGGKPLGIRFSFRDITERKHMEEQLRHQALHDPLTNLANRTVCLDRLGQAMHRAKRRDNYFFAVIFLDLDRFKVINDSLGHHFGDMVLIETATRLSEEMRGLDTVSRFGGDEFVLLLDELASPGEAIRIIKRIRKKMSTPFHFYDKEVQTTASFGIVLSPIGDSKPADILQQANIAMHHAKDTGRNRFRVFTERMLETAVDQLSLENDMRRGLEADEFHLEYQPILNLDDSDLRGFEALIRWQHPKRGILAPSDFIPIAEESGLIIQLGEWVLHTALKTLAHWRELTPNAKDITMSVNLSSKQFSRLRLDQMVIRALKESGLPPSSLQLEITESAIMNNTESAIRSLHRLRKAGIHFSIDDFGTGYSSLSQLQQLPVDTLKVDRGFVSRMRIDQENMDIVRAVIALAHSLGLGVIAEGVETTDQLCSLINLKCENVQGFFFHQPMVDQQALRLILDRTNGEKTTSREKIEKAKQNCGCG
ncbi:EAL domain-containing protein [Pseudodesulfovibrio sp. JC047]|uniref:EAL domain-containing protein n=1 Tax=Pseudodesulfovibrio sp. JC047 TaxID=2683199 RepID=UPI0013D45FD9|nr:EAL domain-containing protein [Pseudodesulfovibrio sp. JC047]NDV18107.1 EAL domain-containing protein [Pseudodesulfovibrio sp. JC047]